MRNVTRAHENGLISSSALPVLGKGGAEKNINKLTNFNATLHINRNMGTSIVRKYSAVPMSHLCFPRKGGRERHAPSRSRLSAEASGEGKEACFGNLSGEIGLCCRPGMHVGRGVSLDKRATGFNSFQYYLLTRGSGTIARAKHRKNSRFTKIRYKTSGLYVEKAAFRLS